MAIRESIEAEIRREREYKDNAENPDVVSASMYSHSWFRIKSGGGASIFGAYKF